MAQADAKSPYNATDEITWFISVTKQNSDTWETFIYEYNVVHAGMVQEQHKAVGTPRAYIQLAVTDTIDAEELHPGWNFLTCLTWESVAQVYDGLQSQGYKESAGKHIFCRLDQKGGMFKKVAGFPPRDSHQPTSGCQMVVFHRRSDSKDEPTEAWFQGRLRQANELSSDSLSLQSYNLFEDVTPKDEKHFFANSQFSGGSWLLFKAVERFDFASIEECLAFMQKHRAAVIDGQVGVEAPVVVIRKPTVVV